MHEKKDTGDFYVVDNELSRDFRALSHKILDLANRATTRIEFLQEISKLLINACRCNSIEIWLKGIDKFTHCEHSQEVKGAFSYNVIRSIENQDGELIPLLPENSIIDFLRIKIILGLYDPTLSVFTKNGSFWLKDTEKSLTFLLKPDEKERYSNHRISGSYKSIAMIPLAVGEEIIGIWELKSKHRDFYNEDKVRNIENFAQILAISIINQQVQADLRERVKELSCLYSIAQIAEGMEKTIDEILQGITELLPPAWQYPEVCAGMIILDGNVYKTSGLLNKGKKQVAEIIVKGEHRGTVEVMYTTDKPALDEGPFLREERNLIDAIARQISLIVERKEVEEDRVKLEEQLRHADRLATIGQLAAGVAHELNEPLGNILGFAQLIKKNTVFSEQVEQDTQKIVNASLHARDIIKKLMIFARHMPPQIAKVNLNKIVDEGLYFFEDRCKKAGIILLRKISPDIPEIIGDEAQLKQVLVNLVVNSLHAMPNGGRLTIQTGVNIQYVFLIVEDTGIGISEDIIEKIFLPFFTTKDVNEGTGLGLAVVHGIVTAHQGIIKVESADNQGTKFEIHLPRQKQSIYKGKLN
jgi:signal transduction histidine kinase